MFSRGKDKIMASLSVTFTSPLGSKTTVITFADDKAQRVIDAWKLYTQGQLGSSEPVTNNAALDFMAQEFGLHMKTIVRRVEEQQALRTVKSDI
jgi:hypothetical protein